MPAQQAQGDHQAGPDGAARQRCARDLAQPKRRFFVNKWQLGPARFVAAARRGHGGGRGAAPQAAGRVSVGPEPARTQTGGAAGLAAPAEQALTQDAPEQQPQPQNGLRLLEPLLFLLLLFVVLFRRREPRGRQRRRALAARRRHRHPAGCGRVALV